MSEIETTLLSNKIVPLRHYRVESNCDQTNIISINERVNLGEIGENASGQSECVGGICEIRWKPSKIA